MVKNLEISQRSRPQVHLFYQPDSLGYVKLLVSNIMTDKSANVAFNEENYSKGICVSTGFEFDLLLRPRDYMFEESVTDCSKLSMVFAVNDSMNSSVDVEIFVREVKPRIKALAELNPGLRKTARFYVCMDIWLTDEDAVRETKDEFIRYAGESMPDITFTLFVTHSRRTLSKVAPTLLFSQIVQKMFFIRVGISALLKEVALRYFDANTFLSLWDCSTVVCFGSNNSTYNDRALNLIVAALDSSYYHLPEFRSSLASGQNDYVIDDSSFTFSLKETKFSSLLVPLCFDRMVLSVVQDVTKDFEDLERKARFVATILKDYLSSYESCQRCEDDDFSLSVKN